MDPQGRAHVKKSDEKKSRSKKKKKAGKTGRASAVAGVRVEPALLDQLVQEAKAVRERAYAPYSGYAVGAAIVTKSGSLYVGCNVENSSFGATICAERGAIMQMIAHGERDPVACAVVTGDDEGASPCGICRQVLAEFARDMPIVLVGLGSREGETGRVVQLADLLPLAFELKT
jgi:cytidine deaminase